MPTEKMTDARVYMKLKRIVKSIFFLSFFLLFESMSCC